MDKKLFFVLIFALSLVLVPFVSGESPFTCVSTGLFESIFGSVNFTQSVYAPGFYYANGTNCCAGNTITDTNETDRVENRLFNCSGTHKASGFFDNGTLICSADVDSNISESDPLWGANYSNGYNNTNWDKASVFVTNNSFYQASNPSAYISDGNTLWTNEYDLWSHCDNSSGCGYLTSESDAGWTHNFSNTYNNVNWDAAYTYVTNSTFYPNSNPSGFISSYTESDPQWSHNFSNGYNKTAWDSAYGWGDHSAQGYITDGNTNWDNNYGFFHHEDNITCTSISGLSADLCDGSDADTIYVDTWINNTINSKDQAANTSLKAYVDAQDNLQDECSEITNCVVGAITEYTIQQSLNYTLNNHTGTLTVNESWVSSIAGSGPIQQPLNYTINNHTGTLTVNESWIISKDTNDSTRVNAMIGTCSGTQFVFGHAANGARWCGTPSFTIQQSLNFTLDNSTGTLTVNKTWVESLSGSYADSWINGSVDNRIDSNRSLLHANINLNHTDLNTRINNANDSMKSYVDGLNGTWEDVDTNESTRFNNFLAFTCLSTDRLTGIFPNGTVICNSTGGGYVDDWINASVDSKVGDNVTYLNTNINLNYTAATNYADTQDATQDECSEITNCVVGAITAFTIQQPINFTLSNTTGTLTVNKTWVESLGGSYSDAWINGSVNDRISSNTTYLNTNINTNRTSILADVGSAGYFNNEANITCTSISGLSADLCDNGDADTIYVDAWINQTIDSKDQAANASLKAYVDTQDNAQDHCSEITGCVENAITDGNTNWDNSYDFPANATHAYHPIVCYNAACTSFRNETCEVYSNGAMDCQA